MASTQVLTGSPPAIKTGADLAFFLRDWLTVTVPNAAERAEALRQISAVLWTRTSNVVDALECAAAECDPGANEPEPVEWDLGDIDGFERTGSASGIFTPTEFDAWLTEESARG